MQRFLLFLTVAVISIASVFATPVSMDDAIAAAKSNNISIEIAKIELEKSLRNASTLENWLPDFSLNGSISTNASAINQTFNPINASMNLGVSYSLGTGMIGSAELARIQETIANITYATTVSSLEESVRTAYLNLQSSKISIDSSKVTLENLKRTYESTKEMYDSGLSSELNVLEAELAIKKAEYSLKALNDAYDLSLDAFKILTGITLDDIELDELDEAKELKLPSAEALIAENSNNILKLQSSDASIAQAEVNAKTTKIQTYYPSVSFTAGWDLTSSGSVNSSWKGSGNTNDSFHATVAFSVPLSSYIPGSTGNKTVKNAEDNVKVAKLNKENTINTLTTTVKNSISSIEQQYENIALAEDNLELSEKTLELRRESYEAGLSTLSDMITAENSKLSAELSLSSAKSQYIKSVYGLATALGTTKTELENKYSI